MPIGWNEISANANGGTEQCARLLEKELGAELDDFWIVPSRVRELKEDKFRIYWLHDLPWDPETNHLTTQDSRDRFQRLVFCGNWQRAMYQGVLGVPMDEQSIVIETPIEPIDVDWAAKGHDDGKIHLVYTSTPQRGLDILVAVFVELAKTHKNIHLDVFSSFKIYGFDNADAQFEEVFKVCREHPDITYHGAQPNDVVREHLKKSHIFAYPSTWLECNSRSLIEAMSAGLLCVHADYGGLADTAGGLTRIYPYHQDKQRHAQVFHQMLEQAILDLNTDVTQAGLRFTKTYADVRYNKDRIMAQWRAALHNIRMEYDKPSPLPDEMFRVKIGN